MYCKPHNAGLASETGSVCRRIGRLMTSLDTELNAFIVEGEILKDIRDFRHSLMCKLESEGWSMSYDGTDRLKVRAPDHRKPFPRRTLKAEG